MTLRRKILVVLAVALVVVIATHMPLILHWAYTFLGVNGSAPYGTFFGDFGSDIGELALFGGIMGMLRQHNCEVRGCLRLGRHTTSAGHKVCRKHHPDEHLTAQDVIDAHNLCEKLDTPPADA